MVHGDWTWWSVPLVQTGSECAAASSHCPPVARKWRWRRRPYSGWRQHLDCRSHRSPWPPGPRSGPECSPGRWDSSSRNSVPIVKVGTHLRNTHTHRVGQSSWEIWYTRVKPPEELLPAAVHSNYTVSDRYEGGRGVQQLKTGLTIDQTDLQPPVTTGSWVRRNLGLMPRFCKKLPSLFTPTTNSCPEIKKQPSSPGILRLKLWLQVLSENLPNCPIRWKHAMAVFFLPHLNTWFWLMRISATGCALYTSAVGLLM